MESYFLEAQHLNCSATNHHDATSPLTSEVNNLRTIEINWKAYAIQLDDLQLSEAEKQEFILALWSILIFLWGAGYTTKTAGLEKRVD